MQKIILIDNYDSFTYNINQLVLKCIQILGGQYIVSVIKNDDVGLARMSIDRDDVIIIGPGPGSPKDTGYCIEFLNRYPLNKTLGICLGHQLLAELHGAKIEKARHPMHGKCSRIFHDGSKMFYHIPNGIKVARYHSLSIKPEQIPSSIKVTSHSDDGEIMSFEILNNSRFGLQFHPESFLSNYGEDMIINFLSCGTRQ